MADRRLKRHLSQDKMNRGIGMLHSGLSQRHVANVLGVSQSVVSRMWNRFITTRNVRHLHAGGRERSTNEVQDRFLVVQARRHRFDNATTLRPVQPASVQELRQALLEEWDQIPQYKMRRLISSMRRRCQAVIEAREHHTRY